MTTSPCTTRENPGDEVAAETRAISGRDLAGLARDLLGRGLPFQFRAHGRSMAPTLRDGDLVTLHPVVPSELGRGEIAAVVLPEGALAIHRIIDREGDRFLVQGDRRRDPDGWMPAGAVIGRVTRVERHGRAVRLGRGPEQALLALLKRRGWWNPLAALLRRVPGMRRPAGQR